MFLLFLLLLLLLCRSLQRREDAARSETNKLNATLGSVQAQVAGQESLEEEVRDARQREEEANAKRAASEALLRRLDNERSYLRSQLTSEVTLKNELQATLDGATRQLGELKQSSRTEREKSESDWKREKLSLEQMETDLRNANMALETECNEKGKQLESTRQLFAKTRDQLRLDQASLESLRAVNRRLVDELKAAQDEVESAQGALKEAQSRASMSMSSMRGAVEDTTAKSNEQVNRLRLDLQEALGKVAEAQKEMLSMKQRLGAAELRNKQHMAAGRIHQVLENMFKAKLGAGLKKWHDRAMKMKMESQIVRRVDEAVAATSAAAAEEKERSCSQLAATLREERDAQLRTYQTEAARLQQEAVATAVAAAEGAAAEQMAAAAAVAEKRVAELENERLVHLRELEQHHGKNLMQKDKEAEERAAAAVRETARKSLEDKQRTLLEAEERWRALMTSREQQLRAEHEERAERQAEANDRLLNEHTAALRAEKGRLEGEFAEKEAACLADVAAARDEASKAHDALAQCESALDAAKADMDRQAEDHKVILHVEKEEAVKAARVVWQSEQEKLQAQWNAEAEAARLTALQEARDASDESRGKAVKLEGSKWQRNMRDLETRMDVEKQAAWRRGMDERDKLAQEEAKQLREAAAKALEEVKGSAKASLEGAMKDAREAARRAQKAGSEAGRAEAEKEAEQRAQMAKHEHELAMVGAAARATEERVRAVEEARAAEEARMDSYKGEVALARENWEREARAKDERAEGLEQRLEGARSDAKKETERHRLALERAAADGDAASAAAQEALRESLKLQHDEHLRRELEQEKARGKAELRETEERVAREMGSAMQQLQDESEKLISQLEARLVTTKEEKEEQTRQLMSARNEIEEQGDTIYDLNNALKAAGEDKEAVKAQAADAAKAKALEHEKKLQRQKEVWQGVVAEAERMAALQDDAMRSQNAEAEALIEDAEHYRAQMHDTLVNHKREALVQHQTQSAGLQKQLEALGLERDGLESRKDKLLDEIGEMERSIKSLEQQIRDHSQQSAISDGRINVAYARKKKRLDEEYEVLLEAIDQKRRAVEDMDKKLEEAHDRERTKEDALKQLERQLVEVLVEQQKRLLKILTDAGTANARYQKAKEGNAERAAQIKGKAPASEQPGGERITSP
jgi:hypothetical protein